MKMLVLLGPPGSGKGTQAHLLQQQGWLRISTGDLLRDIVNKDNELSKKIKTILAAGKLVKDEIVFDLIKEEILNNKDKDIVLDGFPRNAAQAKMLIKFALNYDIIIILMKLTDAEIIKRNTARRICKNCQRIYNINLLPINQTNVCIECGSELYQRNDDKEEVIRERINVYNKEIDGILKIFKDKYKINEVDANRPPEEIYKEINDII